MEHAHEETRKITIFHATAPTCWWSWGYEGALNRVRLVYGDQVDVRLLYGTVWEDFDEYLKGYELTVDAVNEWAEESADLMGVPIRANYGTNEPRNLVPATYATLAARKQGEKKGERFARALLRRFVVEGRDVTQEDVLLDAAQEAGLDLTSFHRDLADTAARQADRENQGEGFPHLPLGFYALTLTDGGDRTVLLDHAFDPKVVEEAIDYLSRGALRKSDPTDVVAYLREHGLAPTMEIARVFGVPAEEMGTRLAALAREGKTERVDLAGGPHWKV
jgi:predicted DsbA family dithiol-disulfide isomerase